MVKWRIKIEAGGEMGERRGEVVYGFVESLAEY